MCSLLPEEFKQMVTDIRTIEVALGSRNKKFLPSETNCFEKLGKSIVAARNLSSGEVLTEADMSMKVSVPNGVPAKKHGSMIEAKLIRPVRYDEPILEEYLEF